MRRLPLLLIVLLTLGCTARKKEPEIPRPWKVLFLPEKGVVA